MASGLPDPEEHRSISRADDARTFAASLVDQVNRDDIPQMVYIQRDMLGRFEKTNEMLINFNMLSSGRYEATVKEFQKHTQLLFDMKKDLNSIFRRIRVVKNRLEKSYPDAFAACSHTYTVASDDEEEEGDDEESPTKTYSASALPETKTPEGDEAQSGGQSISSHDSQNVHVQRKLPETESTGPIVNFTNAENVPEGSQVSSSSPSDLPSSLKS